MKISLVGGKPPDLLKVASKPSTGPLGEPGLRIYLGAMVICLTGMMLDMQVRSMLVRDLVSSKEQASFLIGMMNAMTFLPGILIAPFAGGYCDRKDIKNVLRITNAIEAAQAFLLVYLCFTHTISVAWVISLAFVMGIVKPIDAVARNSIIPLMAQDEGNVRPASQMFNSLYNIAQVIGPGCGAMLVIHINYSGVFFLNGLSFVILILALFKISYAKRVFEQLKAAHAKPRNIQKELQEGAKATFGDSGIRICIILSLVTTVIWFGLYPIFNVIAEEFYKGTPKMIKHAASMLSGISGAGSFSGVYLSMYLAKRKVSIRYLYCVGTVLMGVSLFLFAHTPTLVYGCITVFFGGACFMGPFSLLRGTIPHLAKDNPTLMGVIIGFTLMCFFGGMALGGLTIGSSVKHFGCHDVVVVSSVMAIITGIVAWFLPPLKELE